jgi:hypothetical protein
VLRCPRRVSIRARPRTGARLGRRESWVCRRLLLAKQLDGAVQADVPRSTAVDKRTGWSDQPARAQCPRRCGVRNRRRAATASSVRSRRFADPAAGVPTNENSRNPAVCVLRGRVGLDH